MEIALDKITDLKQLQAMRGEEFVKREQATNLINQCNQNINMISERINQVSGDLMKGQGPKGGKPGEAPVNPEASAPAESASAKPDASAEDAGKSGEEK